MMRFLAGFVTALAVLVLAWLLVVWTGVYNVAATDQHSAVVRWTLDTAMRTSVQHRASDVRAPAQFSDEQVRRGFRHFDQTCVHCHGAPGVKRSEWAMGLLPQPPHLSEEAMQWQPAQVYWIVKHGLKMTAMPSFGATHDDEALWSIAAFVEQLPSITPEAYAGLRQELEGSPGGGSSDHGHSGR